MGQQEDNNAISDLLEIMAALRDPESGCPWDLEQSFASIAPYTIEEAYEVADAIARHAIDELADELGDLLFQVVYHARLAEERQAFAFEDVVARICAKMKRRHPHVFGAPVPGDGGHASAAEQSQTWESLKAQEREAEGGTDTGALAGVPVGLPALTRAAKLGRRASRVGFDWPDIAPVRAKVAEELDELDEAVAAGDARSTAAEMGDVLFALANLCRHLDLDPERCLRASNARFERRFGEVERRVRERGGDWRAFDLDALDRFWNAAKAGESGGDTGSG